MYNFFFNPTNNPNNNADPSKSPLQKSKNKTVPSKHKNLDLSSYKEVTKENEQTMDSTDLEVVNPDRISRFYEVPSKNFKTSEDIIHKYGYQLGNKISEGGFAKVYRALHLRSGLEVACKIVELGKKLPDLKPKAAEARDMKNELYIMSMLNNRYIMKLYAHFVVNNNIYIFMKLANNGTLFQLIKDGGSADESECKYFMAQLFVGIEYMHEQGIAHKDLKLENVLLTRDRHKMLHVLITDFGLSRIIRMKSDGNWDLIKSYCGTPTYMAPEVLQNKPYDAFTADIWSLGIMLFSMANSAFPFDVSNRNTDAMMKKQWSWSKNAKTPSSVMLRVLDEMLEPNPNKRIRLAALVRNPWIWSDYVLAKTFC